MIEYFAIFILGAGIAAAIRSVAVYLYRSWFRQGFAGDSSIHFSIIKQLKKNPESRYIDQYVINNEPMSYPFAFHRIAKLFPIQLIEKFPFLPNFLIFTFCTAAFFVYLHYVEKHILLRTDYDFLLIAAAFYLFSTSNLIFDGPAIAYIKLSERLLARMSCGFYLLCLFSGVYWHDTTSIALSIPLGALALTASVFARQAILFTAPLLSLFLLNSTPLLVLVASFMLALLFSQRHFVLGLKHTVLQWKLYKTHSKKGKVVRSELSYFVNIPEILASRDFMGAFSVLLKREPTRLLAFFPEITLLFFFALNMQFRAEFDYLLLAPVIATLIIYLLTSTESLNHLGESYRYVEYNLYLLSPVLLAFIFLNVDQEIQLAGSVGYGIQVIVMVLCFQFIVMPRRKYPEKDEVTEFLNKAALPRDAVIFPVSISAGADICARTDCKSFWYQPGVISTSIYDEYIEEFPFLKRDYRAIFRKHRVTHVVCSKRTLRIMDWAYDFSGLKLICEDDNYIAYSVPAIQ